MTAAAPKPTAKSSPKSPWEGFSGALWQREINVRAFIQLNYTPYEGDETFLAPATARTKRIWETLTKLFVEERKKGVLDISQIPSSITAHAPGYIDKKQRGHRRAPDRGPAQARHHAERRVPDGAERPQGLRLRARPARGGGVHQVPEDPQRGGLRRLHRRHPAMPELARPHRLAGRLRPRPDHRRLPARGPLRSGPPDRAQDSRRSWRSMPSRPRKRSSATARNCRSRSGRSRN